jgi:low affinity Fe/Cu permease
MFDRCTQAVARFAGSGAAIGASLGLVVGWAFAGPAFGYSDLWLTFINTAATVVTFLMMFVIQRTMNRDERAIQVKLNEILRAIEPARNDRIAIEHADGAALDAAEAEDVSHTTGS